MIYNLFTFFILALLTLCSP